MYCDTKIEIHRVPHRAQLALAQTNLAVVEAIDTARRHSVTAPSFFDDFSSFVAFFARVDDDLFAPFLTRATRDMADEIHLSASEDNDDLLWQINLHMVRCPGLTTRGDDNIATHCVPHHRRHEVN